MRKSTFKKLWETEGNQQTPPPEIPIIVDSCSLEVSDFLDKISTASPKEMKQLMGDMEPIHDTPIQDDCSPEVGAFLDQIGKASPSKLKKLLPC